MVKHQILVLIITLSAACMITPTAQGKTGTDAQRSHGRVSFVGEVLSVDTAALSMTLRSGGNTVSFDISNPVLQGYGSIAAIKKGDRVGAGYTADGIHITKFSGRAEKAAPGKAIAGRSMPEKSVAMPPRAQTSRKPLRIARRMKTDGKSFTDVDNNKDGKISPIELSVVVPDLTIAQFRQYDKNHDGHLDRAEFEQIKLP